MLTAVFDSYDSLKPTVRQTVDTDWLCVTDDPALDPDLGWEILYEPRPGVHPNRAAKRPKMLPWTYTDRGLSVWVDASFQVISPTFVADVLAYADPIAQFAHPWRDDVYLEAEASQGMARYDGQPNLEQAAHYRALGHPEHWGLWATGVIARRHTPEVIRMGERWHEEVWRWSFQDQLSYPVVCREVGLRPTALPGNHLGNAWLAYQGSARHG